MSRGKLIFERGDPSGGIFGVVDGLVSVGMDDTKNSIVAGHVFKAGDWFGEAPTLTDTPRQVSAMALRDCTLLNIPVRKMRDICETEPQGWRWLALLLAINTNVAVQIVRDLLISDPHQRIISVIRRLTGNSPLPFEMALTQAEFADMCALSRGVVSRGLGTLEADGAVRRNYGSIEIIDHPTWHQG